MKALYLSIFFALLNTSAIANTVQVSGDNIFPGADSVRATSSESIFTSRDRYSLGSNWLSGAASFIMVVDYSLFPGQGLATNPVRIGLASSSNPAFMTTFQYGPGPFDSVFLTDDLSDRISPDFISINSAATLPPSVVWNASDKTLTLTWSPTLQNDQNYYLFIEFSGVVGGEYHYNAELSQVPVPAAAWLFGTGILGLAGVKRRKRGMLRAN
jgi:hypothetical protein